MPSENPTVHLRPADPPPETAKRPPAAGSPLSSAATRPAPVTKKRRRPVVIVLIAALAVIAVIIGVHAWLHSRDFESTDDAFVDGPVVPISPKVAGRVVDVFVHENQQVKQGDLLVKVDPRDYEVAVQQRQAALDVARAKRESAQISITQAIAHIKTLTVAGASIIASVAAAEADALKS
ncbi:MAG TPA: biotin/lipoyl-binding protein, partial [Chthoniobacteraceae bacterium]